MRSVVAAACAAALAGCSFIPEYHRPAPPVPDRFPAATPGGRAAAELGWREVFGDPRLQALIAIALRENRDLRIAALEVERARAEYRIERADLLPELDAVGAAELRGTPGDVVGQYRVGASASYELDLFGRLRALRAAALEAYLSTEEARRATQLALVGEVAIQYLRERAFAEQLALAERTVGLVEEAHAMTTRLLDAGQRSELDARTAEAQVHAARAEVARLTRAAAKARNALALLIGQPLPADLPPPRALDQPQVIAELGAGVPSTVLVRRPDVLAAEHVLRAANANIGAARAAFLPSISLTGFAGLASTALTGLFGGAGFGWSFTPQISVPLFDGGRNRAALDVAKLRTRIEVARYERTIQVAFREVADALAARATFETQLEAQTARVAAEQARYELSEARYQSGIESYLTVLAAQQDLYASQQQLLEVRFERLANLADLYRALGGGWR